MLGKQTKDFNQRREKKPEDLPQDKKTTSLTAFEKLKVYADCWKAVMCFYLLNFEHKNEN